MLMLFAAALEAPSSARAYLQDANDANTVSPGTVEIELQPIGYLGVYDEGLRADFLIAPSLMIYVGLAERWDLVLITRGYGLIRPGGGYELADSGLFVRRMLRDGSYYGEDGGASVTLQAGVLLPPIPGDPDFGASLALLVSHSWERADLHSNAQADYRPGGVWALWGTIAVEGPTDWVLHPLLEAWVDWEQGPLGGAMVSGLVGGVYDVSYRLSLMGGMRLGGARGYREYEARLSAWFALGGREGDV